MNGIIISKSKATFSIGEGEGPIKTSQPVIADLVKSNQATITDEITVNIIAKAVGVLGFSLRKILREKLAKPKAIMASVFVIKAGTRFCVSDIRSKE